MAVSEIPLVRCNFGMRGYGKSTLARAMVRARPRLLVCDPMIEHEALALEIGEFESYIDQNPLERFRVEVVDPSHPVTRNVNDFWTADEQHTPRYDKTKVHLLLENRSDAGKVAAAGWVYEPGRGRLCHLASGPGPNFWII